MKNFVKYILQRILGYRRYLYFFALFKIKTLKSDRKERDFFHFIKLIDPTRGDLVDLGANLGVMSVHLSKSFPSNTVHAFEPMPDNLAIIKKVFAKYEIKNVEVHAEAVGNEKGTVVMVLPENHGVKMQGLSHVKHESIDEWNEGQEVGVPIVTLDEVLEGKEIAAIKMDIENFEYYALEGARKILSNNRPIIYTELWQNDNRQKCFDLLGQFAYQPYVVIDNKITPYQGQEGFQNFIFKVKSES